MHENRVLSSHKTQWLSTGLVTQEKRHWWKFLVFNFGMFMQCKREEPSSQTYGFGQADTDPSKPCLQAHACWHSSTPSAGPRAWGKAGLVASLLLEPALSQCLPSLPAPNSGHALHRTQVWISWSEQDTVFFKYMCHWKVSEQTVTREPAIWTSSSAHACWLCRVGSLTWVFQSSLIIFILPNKNKFILTPLGQMWSIHNSGLNKPKQKLQKPSSAFSCSQPLKTQAGQPQTFHQYRGKMSSLSLSALSNFWRSHKTQLQWRGVCYWFPHYHHRELSLKWEPWILTGVPLTRDTNYLASSASLSQPQTLH